MCNYSCIETYARLRHHHRLRRLRAGRRMALASRACRPALCATASFFSTDAPPPLRPVAWTAVRVPSAAGRRRRTRRAASARAPRRGSAPRPRAARSRRAPADPQRHGAPRPRPRATRRARRGSRAAPSPRGTPLGQRARGSTDLRGSTDRRSASLPALAAGRLRCVR